MIVVDSKYVDLKVEGGKVVAEFPLIELLRELAKSTDNTLDDTLVGLIEKALAPKEQ